MVLFPGEFANPGPGFRCQGCVVIGLEHSPDGKNPQPGFRIAGRGQLEIVAQGSNLRLKAGRLARSHHPADMCVERLGRLAPLLIEKFRPVIDGSRVDPVVEPRLFIGVP